MQAKHYAEWRERRVLLSELHERAGQPPERLLQAVWLHQRLLRDSLRTMDGVRLRVLHPGYWNREAGPDFRGAVLKREGEAARSGDVEIDLHSRCWRQHKHDRNPTFQGVVLHVVWEAEKPVFFPTLELKPYLDAPLEELALWLSTDTAEEFPAELRGRCAEALKDLPGPRLAELLREAALARLQRKGADLEARARQAGWDQALWEGLFRALGYKHNVWPMLRVGELLPALREDPPSTVLHWQARLFGVSGLLPADLERRRDASDGYVRQIWDWWWRERGQFDELILPATMWRLSGLRPANNPLRRLALAAHWCAQDGLAARLDAWLESAQTDGALTSSLLKVLQAPSDDFWSRRWTLRGRRLEKLQPLAGVSRVTDLAINVVLPWFWARARQEGNQSRAAEAERRYFAWPTAQENSVLGLAGQRLLGGATRKECRSAAHQQGLLQIVRDFCDHSDPLCANCPFPGHVAEFSRSAPTPDSAPKTGC